MPYRRPMRVVRLDELAAPEIMAGKVAPMSSAGTRRAATVTTMRTAVRRVRAGTRTAKLEKAAASSSKSAGDARM